MSEPIPEAAYRLLDDVNYAHVVTLMPDGMPQTTPVWMDREGGVPSFSTAKGRVKHDNLVRDPRIAFSMVDHTNPSCYLQVRGRAELVDDVDYAYMKAINQKYLGRDPSPPAGEERVVVRVIPSEVQWRPPQS